MCDMLEISGMSGKLLKGVKLKKYIYMLMWYENSETWFVMPSE